MSSSMLAKNARNPAHTHRSLFFTISAGVERESDFRRRGAIAVSSACARRMHATVPVLFSSERDALRVTRH